MNKQDLINNVATDTALTKVQAKAAVDATLMHIQSALANSDEAAFIGFGTFKVSSRAARKGVNPQTGEAIDIAASKSVSFKPSKALKAAVN